MDVRVCDCVQICQPKAPRSRLQVWRASHDQDMCKCLGWSLSTTAASFVLFECEHIFVAEERTLVTRESTIAYLSLASIVSLNART